MGIEELRKEILGEADKKIGEIIEEARRKADEIIRDAEKKAEDIVDKKRDSVLKSLREREKSELAIARIDGKRMVHDKKWELVNIVFKKVVEKLREYRGTERYLNETIPSYILKGVSFLNMEEAVLMVNEEDHPKLISKLEMIERFVSEKIGRKISLTIGEKPVRILGGVIVSNKDGNIFYNFSFDSRLIEVRERYTADVLDMLFGDAL